MYKRPVGRPKKVDNIRPLTKEQADKEKKREYMRDYKAKINKEINELSKMEEDCDKELKQIRKDKKMLINELDKSNRQAERILKEAVGKK